jgi:hypothetical protein
MITVPSFLLKRLYVKGSLHNNEQGFQFELKNTLGSGYSNEMLPLTLDGEEISLESSYFILDAEEVPFSAVNKDTPFTLPMNKALTILVKGDTLSDGAHKIGLGFVAQGLGNLAFEVTDLISTT